MGSLWATLAPFVIAAALTPIELVITLALLGTPGRVRTATAATVGTVAVRLLKGLVFGAILHWGRRDNTAGGAGGRVDIEYTADGSNWLPIAMGYTNRNSGAGQIITNVSPRWVITGPPSAIAQVRVRSVSIPTLSMTTLPFSISGVQLVYPK